ncbi:MAG: tetratricopeptide repeat protein [Thermodesulfovibrionales bacterium]|nr:tetratricopeptide repeat protein [Thermodesulfovibrionales bacterium]
MLFSISLSFAGNVTFIKEYTYQASELDSKASCRTISLEMVKRLLLEELGTYLISETEVKDFKLTKEQVKTYSAGIVGAEIIEDKWDGKTYWLKAKVSADPKEAAKALKKIMDDQFKARELEETRKKAEELTKEVERLNKELAKATNKQPSKKVQHEYKTAIQGLTAVEWFNKGNVLRLSEKYSEAIVAFDNAIKINPKFDNAYVLSSRYF